MKIKIVQYMVGNKNLSYVTGRKINESYCRKHGYEYVCSNSPSEKDRYSSWEKVRTLYTELRESDYALFIDADAYFYGHEFRVEEILLPLLENRFLLMAVDCGSEGARWNPKLPNTGVIFARNHIRTFEILKRWDELSDQPEFQKFCWGRRHEQEVFWKTFLKENPDEIAVAANYYLINGYWGLYIRHQMVTPDATRCKLLERYLSWHPLSEY
jgi:hypothetical protein